MSSVFQIIIESNNYAIFPPLPKRLFTKILLNFTSNNNAIDWVDVTGLDRKNYTDTYGSFLSKEKEKQLKDLKEKYAA